MSDNNENFNAYDSDDNSNDNLQIIVESPSRKRKLSPIPTEMERKIIDSIEDELERKLEEKAAKTNLNAVNVKNIIKHVVTNEHVLTLIKNAENNEADDDCSPIFEPKWTRSKIKELCTVPGVPIPPVPGVAPKPLSVVQVLLTKELQEDSSGDEYVPGMCEEDKEELSGDEYVPGMCEEDKEELESEDDPDSSFLSDATSVEPPTPPEPDPPAPSPPPPSETNWTEDGIFKIPSTPKTNEEVVDDATIARRTRSKLCLESTPLEVIEDAFIPPDIPTDMMDEIDCDNEEWMNFLKTFNRPLDEVEKVPEEEELDPEYNVLSDEEIDKPDKEELRVDKAVKVSRKELNALIAELYEFCTIEQAHLNRIEENEKNASNFLECQLIDENIKCSLENGLLDGTVIIKSESELSHHNSAQSITIEDLQLRLLEQQMRQHVQLLTQNFLLTFQHPELHNYSIQMKEYLINLKYLAGGAYNSTFNSINLHYAINMVAYWENLIASNSDDVKKMKQHIERTTYESLKYKQTGSEYILTFPTLILETISKSNIFLYPTLLPKIPFKSPRLFTAKNAFFTDSELQLIAMGLEQFMPIATEEISGSKYSKKKVIQLVSHYIHKYLLPIKQPKEINTQIRNSEYYRCANNPIKYYFQNNKSPPFIQYYVPLEELQVLPPCKRKPEELPYQWKNYVLSQMKTLPQYSPIIINPIAGLHLNTVSKPIFNIQKSILPNGSVTSTPLCPAQRKKRLKRLGRRQKLVKPFYLGKDPITKFIDCLSRPSYLNKVLELFPANELIDERTITGASDETFDILDENGFIKRNSQFNSTAGLLDHCTMLPNMPSLCAPIKIDIQESSDEKNNENSSKRDISLEISDVGVSNFCNTKLHDSTKQSTESSNQENKIENSKDTQDAPSTSTAVKPTTRKESSGTDKKRAKMRKEFLANLAISTPEDQAVEKKKNEMFALAYYDKMRETLEIEAYHKIMQVLNEYEEGDAIDLYHQIEAILRPKYEEIADEFLLFLREKEAATVDRLVPWIQMNNRSKFLKKLEIYFKDQPSQLRKIYQCLTELTQAGVSMEKIRSTLIPMFKGNAFLTDLFLHNFSSEPPPSSLLEGPYEVIDVNKELSMTDSEEPFEMITVPDVDKDKYGTNTCICSCHEIEDVEFKNRFRHCSRCGVKFINGSVYMQTGKGLRQATVSFINSQNDNQARLADKSLQNIYQRKKRSDSSPSKQASSKDNPDEETDEDGDKKKKQKRKPQRNKKQTLTQTNSTKDAQKKTTSKRRNLNKEFKASPRKRIYSMKKSNPKNKLVGIESGEPIETEPEELIETEHEEQVETEVEELAEIEEDKSYIKPGSSSGQQKRLQEESCEEGDQSATGESSGEIKIGSPEQQTAESESEFCEESSQDNCESDSNSSTSSSINRSHSYADVLEKNTSWKREEDKIILEVFQTENDKDNAFKAIANQLKNRTVDEIKARFDTLMELLMKTVESHRD